MDGQGGRRGRGARGGKGARRQRGEARGQRGGARGGRGALNLTGVTREGYVSQAQCEAQPQVAVSTSHPQPYSAIRNENRFRYKIPAK
ncbi:hypothetical protein DVH24_029998 [Malus domestica]|uniref:Uncharacterized protein n=1 Tax=Malus domestica TaxID=3750 RepID=A0A498I082_MALDO|nr:hypothetical protein DVH24_029998 [Malus domestica]